ncbi:MAG: hypothetical protein RXP27_03280 [Nitrososphaeria archaeon]
MGSASARGSDHIVSRLPLSWTEPGRRLASVVVEASGYSAVEEEHRAMESAGARVLATMCAPSEGRVRCESIVDLGGLDPGELESRLRSMKGIGSVSVREGAVPGFACLPGRILEAAGTRSVLMTSRALRGMLLGMREFLGEEVGETALYYIGYYSGRGGGAGARRAPGPGGGAARELRGAPGPRVRVLHRGPEEPRWVPLQDRGPRPRGVRPPEGEDEGEDVPLVPRDARGDP